VFTTLTIGDLASALAISISDLAIAPAKDEEEMGEDQKPKEEEEIDEEEMGEDEKPKEVEDIRREPGAEPISVGISSDSLTS
jgi:hypothetical protein